MRHGGSWVDRRLGYLPGGRGRASAGRHWSTPRCAIQWDAPQSPPPLPLRKKNKWLPKIHQWVQEHGGGLMIPFSIEWEQKLWNLRDDPDGKQVRGGRGEGEEERGWM